VRAIVGELKVFSRVDEQMMRPVDVRGTVESALAMANNEIRPRARLVRDFAPVDKVMADEGRLSQVFLNLLVNAAHAIPEGDEGEQEVRVVLRQVAGRVKFEVHDTGVGIAPEVLPRIFDPFFTTKAVGAGTGLGLAICHAIVTALGGRIELESSPGRKTTARVILPAVTTALDEGTKELLAERKGGKRGFILVIGFRMVRSLPRVLRRAAEKPVASAQLRRAPRASARSRNLVFERERHVRNLQVIGPKALCEVLLDERGVEVTARIDVHHEERSQRPGVDRTMRGREHADPGDAALVLEGLDAELGDFGLDLVEVGRAEETHPEEPHQLAQHRLDASRVSKQGGLSSTEYLYVSSLRHLT
jgi:Histidine kinase-, DNA gyrase B-, and HSP90-like ATPase